jgi:hypothetical protein
LESGFSHSDQHAGQIRLFSTSTGFVKILLDADLNRPQVGTVFVFSEEQFLIIQIQLTSSISF